MSFPPRASSWLGSEFWYGFCGILPRSRIQREVGEKLLAGRTPAEQTGGIRSHHSHQDHQARMWRGVAHRVETLEAEAQGHLGP